MKSLPPTPDQLSVNEENVFTIGYNLGQKRDPEDPTSLSDILDMAADYGLKYFEGRKIPKITKDDYKNAIKEHSDNFIEAYEIGSGVTIINDLSDAPRGEIIDVEFSEVEDSDYDPLKELKGLPGFSDALSKVKKESAKEEKENIWAEWLFQNVKDPGDTGYNRTALINFKKKLDQVFKNHFDKVAPELKELGILRLDQTQPDEDYVKEMSEIFNIAELLKIVNHFLRPDREQQREEEKREKQLAARKEWEIMLGIQNSNKEANDRTLRLQKISALLHSPKTPKDYLNRLKELRSSKSKLG